MPHQCTECGHTFPDGSKEMLSGCPDCGGTKFQFRPEGAPEPATEETPDPPDRPDSGVADTVGKAASTVRDLMGGSNAPDPRTSAADSDTADSPDTTDTPDSTDFPDSPGSESTTDSDQPDAASADAPPETGDTEEDAAQASARSDVVTTDELPDPPERSDADRPDPEGGTVVSEPTGESPGLDELREELNDQFESIRIVEPGQYELNLMELYDRDEYIIALQENGKYSIQVPETWLGDDE